MNNNLLESTYALNNLPNLKNLLGTVLSWRLFDLFMENKARLAEFENQNTFDQVASFLEAANNSTSIKCGFSIKSNVNGLLADFDDIDDNIIQVEKDLKIKDIVFHHVYGTHTIDEIIPLSTKQHTKLHSEIKKIYFEKILKNNAINKVYDEFVTAHEKTANGGYSAFGDRVKAYEVTLVRIAVIILDLIDKDVRATIYKKALENLQANNIIPKDIEILTASKLSTYTKKKHMSDESSIAESFHLYENLWG